jgi:hypothetical protein
MDKQQIPIPCPICKHPMAGNEIVRHIQVSHPGEPVDYAKLTALRKALGEFNSTNTWEIQNCDKCGRVITIHSVDNVLTICDLILTEIAIQ